MPHSPFSEYPKWVRRNGKPETLVPHAEGEREVLAKWDMEDAAAPEPSPAPAKPNRLLNPVPDIKPDGSGFDHGGDGRGGGSKKGGWPKGRTRKAPSKPEPPKAA